MNTVKFNRNTLDKLMLGIIEREGTTRERPTDQEIFIKCALKFLDLMLYEKTNQGKGNISTGRDELNRGRVRSNARTSQARRRNTDVAI